MHTAQALAKYAFGLGTLTMAASTVIFTLFALPPGHGIGTQILVKVTLPFLSANPAQIKGLSRDCLMFWNSCQPSGADGYGLSVSHHQVAGND